MPAPVSCPAILVSAPASGQGKTTVSCALARLHARQGRKISVFKCGPDFLDPFWLGLASGSPVGQLDLWMTGEDDCRRRLHEAAQRSDLIIVEGVMGLFDGAPSAADLAQRFGLPVLAVIDAGAMSGTFGALAWGLQHYREGLSFAGVLANRVASEAHGEMLRESLREPALWQGALPRDAGITLPERHLGLVMDHEIGDALARLDHAADALAATPLGRMGERELQAWSVAFDAAPAQTQLAPLLAGKTIAVARDAAFCFIYAANLQCLQALGASLVFFSPLADAALSACDALWLPGGYPELHAARLAENLAMKSAIAAHVAAGKPVWAECGGMMALFDELVALDGSRYPMWACLPGTVTMQQRLAALGPQRLDLGDGELRGHTFHYSTCSTALAAIARTIAAPGRKLRGEGEACYRHGPQGALRASYFHAWFASHPQAAARLFLKDEHD